MYIIPCRENGDGEKRKGKEDQGLERRELNE